MMKLRPGQTFFICMLELMTIAVRAMDAKFRRNLQPKTSLLSDSLLRDTRPSYPTKNEFVSAGRVGFEISIEIFVEDLQNRVSHQFDLQGTASCITLHATKDVEVQNFLRPD